MKPHRDGIHKLVALLGRFGVSQRGLLKIGDLSSMAFISGSLFGIRQGAPLKQTRRSSHERGGSRPTSPPIGRLANSEEWTSVKSIFQEKDDLSRWGKLPMGKHRYPTCVALVSGNMDKHLQSNSWVCQILSHSQMGVEQYSGPPNDPQLNGLWRKHDSHCQLKKSIHKQVTLFLLTHIDSAIYKASAVELQHCCCDFCPLCKKLKLFYWAVGKTHTHIFPTSSR